MEKFNTEFLDLIIDCSQIVHDFTYNAVSTTDWIAHSNTVTVTVDATKLVNLQTKINRMKQIRDSIKTSYDEYQKTINGLLDNLK